MKIQFVNIELFYEIMFSLTGRKLIFTQMLSCNFQPMKMKKKKEIPSIVRGLKFDIMFLDCNIYNFEAVILLNKCILSITFSHMHMDISIMVQHKTLFKISAFGLDKLAIRIQLDIISPRFPWKWSKKKKKKRKF